MDPNGENISRLTLDPNSENRQLHSHRTRNPSFSYPIRPETISSFTSMDVNGQSPTRLSDPGRNIQSFAFLPLPLTLFNQ